MRRSADLRAQATGEEGEKSSVEWVLSAPQVVAETEVLTPGGIVVRDGRIRDVFSGRPPRGSHVELPSGTLVPGFVDLQVNGYLGVDFAAADGDDWLAPARALAAEGVT